MSVSSAGVVAGAADVGVLDRSGEFDLLGWVVVESVGEDRLDASVAMGADGQRPCGGGFEAFVAVALRQAQDAEAGTECLLRVTARVEHGGDEPRGVRSDLLGPADKSLRGPLAHTSVLLGHVRVDGGVMALARGAHVEALHGGRGQAYVELASNQGVGDAVVVAVDFAVVVDVDSGLFPLGEHVALGRKGTQRRAVGLLEQRTPRARELAERAGVEPFKEPGDGGVEFAEGEERAVAKRSQDPALNDLHADLDLGLVARLSHPRWQHRDPVVLGQVVVGRIRVRLVAMSAAHRRSMVVWVMCRPG